MKPRRLRVAVIGRSVVAALSQVQETLDAMGLQGQKITPACDVARPYVGRWKAR
ncbi:hypothetical protein [Variovorax atrisoli]|uniref:hypothetical protein n=1 Tax=Variovorax atrisoli TaxID=3394203 RepID=UPI003399EC5B